MISFIYTGKRQYSQQEKQDAEDFFIRYIGDVKEDFDKNNVVVTVNTDAIYPVPKYTYGSDPDEIGVLVWKVQEYRKKNPFIS
jgi:hypothetical protein